MVGVAARRAVPFELRLAGATALPWLAVLVAGSTGMGTGTGFLFLASAVFGVSHVGTTAAFYADRELRPILNADPRRYYFAPALLIAGSAAVFAFGSEWMLVTFVVVQAGWSIHHFTRQNLGVFAFMCRARRDKGPTPAERRIFDLTGYAGMCGIAATITPYGIAIPGASTLFAFAGLGLLAVAGGLVILGSGEPWRRAAMGGGVLFYAPLFLMRGNLGVAVLSYGIAHAIQYMLMMGQLRSGRANGTFMLLAVVAGWAVVGMPLWQLGRVAIDGPFRVALGIHYGIVLTHFVVDAGVWKLRDPEQRAYMQRRFAFL